MAGFNRIKDIVDNSYEAGKTNFTVFRKTPAIATTKGLWHDLSSAPGYPKPNYYASAEMVSETLEGDDGIWHGGGGKTTTDGFKFLHKLYLFAASANVVPANFILCDYLMYYPLIDMDNTSPQPFTNYPTGKALPRYTDGMGVQAMLVATNPYVGGARFQITYTNENGVSDRKSMWTTTNTSTYIGCIVNSGIAATLWHPYVLLQQGDRGIRSVQQIEFNSPNGGLASLVLIKPIANISLYEITALTEVDYVIENTTLPKIYDGAYLNFIYFPFASAATIPIIGAMTTIWR